MASAWKRDFASLTMFVFGALTVIMGLLGLAAPQFLLSILALDAARTGLSIEVTKIFAMASSEASLAMGCYYLVAVATNFRSFYVWSVPFRVVNFVVSTSMVIFGSEVE